MTVNGGATLTIGRPPAPMVVNVGDVLVDGNWDAGDGAITVNGPDSRLTVFGSAALADSGNTGTLTYLHGAQRYLAGLGLAFSGNNLTQGNFNVFSDADVDVVLSKSASTRPPHPRVWSQSTSRAGFLTLRVIGDSTIGGSAGGNFGILNVDASRVFNSGNVTVNPGGRININGGILVLNGDTMVDGGAITGHEPAGSFGQ